MQELNGQATKPHADAILYSSKIGEGRSYPVGRTRDATRSATVMRDGGALGVQLQTCAVKIATRVAVLAMGVRSCAGARLGR